MSKVPIPALPPSVTNDNVDILSLKSFRSLEHELAYVTEKPFEPDILNSSEQPPPAQNSSSPMSMRPYQAYRWLVLPSQAELKQIHYIIGLIYDVLRSNFPLELPHMFCTVEFLRRENHADVFNLKGIFITSDPKEIKVFNLGGLDTKLHRGRVNNIKRLKRSSSYLWSCKEGGHEFVIYIAGKERSERGKPGTLQLNASKCKGDLQSALQSKTIKEPNTPGQKERARIKQQRSRSRKRAERRELARQFVAELDT